jgi:hypothetical protein
MSFALKRKKIKCTKDRLRIELVNHPPKSRTQILKEFYFYCKKTREREREREGKKRKKRVYWLSYFSCFKQLIQHTRPKKKKKKELLHLYTTLHQGVLLLLIFQQQGERGRCTKCSWTKNLQEEAATRRRRRRREPMIKSRNLGTRYELVVQ